MAEPRIDRMSVDEFAAWERSRDGRYELVDGVPRAMTGSTEAHDIVRVRILTETGVQLRHKPCRAVIDVKLVCPNGNVRSPDVQINCHPLDPSSTRIGGATVVCEVLSESTRATDFPIELQDYQSVPSIEAYAIFWQDQPKAVVFRRAGAVLQKAEEPEGLEATVAFPSVASRCGSPISTTGCRPGPDRSRGVPRWRGSSYAVTGTRLRGRRAIPARRTGSRP